MKARRVLDLLEFNPKADISGLKRQPKGKVYKDNDEVIAFLKSKYKLTKIDPMDDPTLYRGPRSVDPEPNEEVYVGRYEGRRLVVKRTRTSHWLLTISLASKKDPDYEAPRKGDYRELQNQVWASVSDQDKIDRRWPDRGFGEGIVFWAHVIKGVQPGKQKPHHYDQVEDPVEWIDKLKK